MKPFTAFDEKYMIERWVEVEVKELNCAVSVEGPLYEIKNHKGKPVCVYPTFGLSFPEFVVMIASGGGLIGKDADLRGIDLGGRDLRRANFTGCDLRNANLSHCKMFGAFFVGADLRGANLKGSDIENAYTTNAIL